MKFRSLPFQCLSIIAAWGITSLAAQAEETYIARHHLTSAQYNDLAATYENAGYRLHQVSGYELNGSARYAARWIKDGGPQVLARHGLSSAQYQSEYETQKQNGFHLIWVDGYNVGNQVYFAGIWEKGNGPAMRTHHVMTPAQYQDHFNDYKADGYRCVYVDGYRSGNDDRYAAIWVKDGGASPRAHHGQTPASYQATVNQNIQDGYHPVHLSAWGAGNSARFASLWEKSASKPFWMRHNLNSQQYQAEADNFHYTGYHLAQMNGYTVNGQARFIAFFENHHMKASDLNLIENRVRQYMADNNIPGLSLAIAKTGNLVYSRGFGFADLETAELVSPSTKMRIASISKPITAVAIMKLVEEGKLSLEDKVFGAGALLGTTYGSKAYTSKVKDIRVKHLLWHSSGWSNEGDDPMFNNHADHDAVIDWMLDNRDPLANPGTQDEYLNFGYCVLGRIIEAVSGQSYEAYVKGHVLDECGITDMKIGAQAKANLDPNEATYYYGNGPYSVIRPDHFDSHGGWIASATDLLRFKVRVDGSWAKKDIITQNTFTEMMSASPAKSTRAMGWFFGNNGHGHNGCMSGTIGFLWDTDDGYTFAILANTNPEEDGCAWTARGMVEDLLYEVSEWPDYDLFTGSHQSVPKIIVNPAAGQLDDLVIKTPVIVPDFPKFEVIDLGSDSSLGKATLLEIPSLAFAPTTPQPELQFQLIPQRSGRVFELSFPTEDGWEYQVQRSTNGSEWSSEPVTPERDTYVRYRTSASEEIELFRIQVQSEATARGIDPTLVPERPILNRVSIPEVEPVGLLLPAVQKVRS